MTEMKRQLWVALFVLLIFVSGLAAGIIATRWSPPGWFGARSGPAAFGGPRAAAGRGASRLIERISERLDDLSDEQRERLEQVFDERREGFRADREAMRRRIEEEEETFRSEIAEILTPEQFETFNAVIVRLGEERQRRGGPGGPGGRGPLRAP